MPSQHVPPSQRKFPLDFMWLDGPSCWRSLIYLLSCRWWNTRDFKKCLQSFSSTSPRDMFVYKYKILLLSFSCSLHFYDSASGLLFLPFHSVLKWLWITLWYSLRNIRSIMSLLPYNNINNLRVYPKPVLFPCRRSRIHFPAGASQTRSSVNGRSTRFLFQPYCRYYQSLSTRLSQCIPITIFHSATLEPRP